jgi:hypothetical protein
VPVSTAGQTELVPTPEAALGASLDEPHDLRVRILDADTVLIEGDRRSLTFLGEVLRAVAADDSDCGYSLGPRAAGSAHFEADSPLGVYVHALPCDTHGDM